MLFQIHLRSSSEHKIRYFWWNTRAFWPCIDSNTTDTFKSQKGSKGFIKTIHVTSVVLFYEATRIIFVCKRKLKQWLYLTIYSLPCQSSMCIHASTTHACTAPCLQACHMDYFNDVLTIFLGLERVSCIAVYTGSESS